MQEILLERHGLQRITVKRPDRIDHEKAYVLTNVIGDVAAGDEVIINTTAVDLGLGTGGWHPVHWNLSNKQWSSASPGHIMKMRYTSTQSDTGVTEEAYGYDEPESLAGIPVVVCLLHSQIAAVAAVIRKARPHAHIAYVMTDQASLPLALSDLADTLVQSGLLDFTVTSGQSFGGSFESVNVSSGMLVARAMGAEFIIVGQGPGVVGTGTAHGFSGLECAANLTSARVLGGQPILALRWSDADERERHQGLSHHSRTVLAHTLVPVTIGVPGDMGLLDVLPAGPHTFLSAPTTDIDALFEQFGITVTSMGRSPREDPGFFDFAAAAGHAAVAAASNVMP